MGVGAGEGLLGRAIEDNFEAVDSFGGYNVHVDLDSITVVVGLMFGVIDADCWFQNRGGGGCRRWGRCGCG